MAKPIPPTPDIKIEEELGAFLESMNRPPTTGEIELGKKVREVYENTKLVRHNDSY